MSKFKDYVIKEMNKAKEAIERLEKEVFVRDYFLNCPTNNSMEYIPKSMAVKFRVLQENPYEGLIVVDLYTSQESYSMHKMYIDDCEKKVRVFLREEPLPSCCEGIYISPSIGPSSTVSKTFGSEIKIVKRKKAKRKKSKK